MTASSGVAFSVSGPVATLTLHHAGKRNALGLQSWRTLAGLIATAESDATIRLIVVRGSNGHFSAGNDIAELSRADAPTALAFAGAMAETTRAIEAASKPVVMAIEGVCYGASVALALAGDIRVASSNSVFAITPAKLGLLYLGRDLQRLVAAIGIGQTKRLIYTADAIDAAHALTIGLVDEVHASDHFERGLQRLVNTIVAGSTFTLQHTKEMLRTLGEGRASPETHASLNAFATATQGSDFAEGQIAFHSRRPPRFG